MMRRLLAVLTVTCALCLSLVGCGGGGDVGDDTAKPPIDGAGFVGVWELDSMTEGERSFTPDDLDVMRSYGLNVYLTVAEEGSATMYLYGEEVRGSWEPTSPIEGIISLEESESTSGLGAQATMTLADGTLTIGTVDQATLMVFTQTTQEEMDEFISEAMDDSHEDDQGTETDDSSSASHSLDVVVADDETILLRLMSVEDNPEGEPTVHFTVENKTGSKLYLTDATDSWSVGGVAVDPIVSTSIDPHATVDDYFLFDKDEVGGGAERLVEVTGSFELQDGAGNSIATYEVAL